MTSQNTDDQENVLILSDQDGNYYMLSPLVLAQTRVAPEHRADVEKLLHSDEVVGYGSNPPTRVVGMAQPGSRGPFPVTQVATVNLSVLRVGGFGVAMIQTPY